MKRQTRAQRDGVNVRKLARQAERFAERVKVEGQKVAYEWAEIDNTVASGVDELLGAVESFLELVKGGIEYLKEIPEDQE